jgi:CRP-like cAMP-binding protein
MIEAIRLFRDLGEEDKQTVSGLLAERHFKSGEVVFREGDPGDVLSFVTKGKVKVCKTTPEGEQFCIISLSEGELFGIMSFLDGTSHDATIIADMETSLMTLQKKDFDHLMATNTLLAARILKSLAIHLATIVRSMNDGLAVVTAFEQAGEIEFTKANPTLTSARVSSLSHPSLSCAR